MGDLRPQGIPIQLGGAERHFLFTLNVIDEVQSHYNTDMLNALSKLYDEEEGNSALRYFVTVLLNDEAERENWMHPEYGLKKITENEAGWLINIYNISEVALAILRAYRLSVPESDASNDPNQMSGRQNS